MLAKRVIDGDLRAASRLMRDIDDRVAGVEEELRALTPRLGRALVVGVTGSPGAGKSTLVDRLIATFRARGKSVGVVAVDPSSPLSGGAILGDRIRMQEHALDPGVFIRSLATRGELGGLSAAARGVVQVMDAMGRDVIIVETVGVGQAELEIARLAHATVVVLVPGMGDDIQALKAGILEIADLFAVNKADREGAERVVLELRTMLELRPSGAPEVEIVKVSALKGEGIEELVGALERVGRRRHSTPATGNTARAGNEGDEAIGDRVAELGKRVGHRFSDRERALAALTHPSFVNESSATVKVLDNERLEFLGDAVVDLAIAHRLMERFPNAKEGALSRMRAELVDEAGLARAARALGLGELLRLGKGEERSGGRERASLNANAFEAVVACLWLEGGMEQVLTLVDRLFGEALTALSPGARGKDFKTALQEAVQAARGYSPNYRLVKEEGPEHARRFTVEVLLGGEPSGRGEGRNKKEAEQAAAGAALALLEGAGAR